MEKRALHKNATPASEPTPHTNPFTCSRHLLFVAGVDAVSAEAASARFAIAA